MLGKNDRHRRRRPPPPAPPPPPSHPPPTPGVKINLKLTTTANTSIIFMICLHRELCKAIDRFKDFGIVCGASQTRAC